MFSYLTLLVQVLMPAREYNGQTPIVATIRLNTPMRAIMFRLKGSTTIESLIKPTYISALLTAARIMLSITPIFLVTNDILIKILYYSIR